MDTNNTTGHTRHHTRTIYYWLDGYWITDREEAELMDSINAFGSLHQTVELPADADPALIDSEITALLFISTGREPQCSSSKKEMNL